MADPVFRLVCVPAALADAPAEWARAMLAEGEIALLRGDGGLDEIDALAHHLDLRAVALLRGEADADAGARTVIEFAGGLPLVWIAPSFTDDVRTWAHDRGPMTLLVAASGALDEDERRRVERFVASLGRQSE
jgi:hypothetical protein